MPHWIQIENDANGEELSRLILDLEKVTSVVVIENKNEISMVAAAYPESPMKGFEFTGRAAKFFLDEWYKFLEQDPRTVLKAKAEKAEVGLIAVPTSFREREHWRNQ